MSPVRRLSRGVVVAITFAAAAGCSDPINPTCKGNGCADGPDLASWCQSAGVCEVNGVPTKCSDGEKCCPFSCISVAASAKGSTTLTIPLDILESQTSRAPDLSIFTADYRQFTVRVDGVVVPCQLVMGSGQSLCAIPPGSKRLEIVLVPPENPVETTLVVRFEDYNCTTTQPSCPL